MDGELYAHDNVWFGAREPEWWEEDLDDWEDRLLKTSKNSPKKKPIRITKR